MAKSLPTKFSSHAFFNTTVSMDISPKKFGSTIYPEEHQLWSSEKAALSQVLKFPSNLTGKQGKMTYKETERVKEAVREQIVTNVIEATAKSRRPVSARHMVSKEVHKEPVKYARDKRVEDVEKPGFIFPKFEEWPIENWEEFVLGTEFEGKKEKVRRSSNRVWLVHQAMDLLLGKPSYEEIKGPDSFDLEKDGYLEAPFSDENLKTDGITHPDNLFIDPWLREKKSVYKLRVIPEIPLRLPKIHERFKELENTRDSVDGGEDKINDGGTGQDYYLLACKRLGLIPTEKFWKSLPGKAINLSYFGVNPVSVEAMADALSHNSTVTEINLQENFLSPCAAFHMSEILGKNLILTNLNLSGCRIGAEGAEKLAEGIALTTSLKNLNLSKNRLGDPGMQFLVKGLELNESIETLNLSHNELETGSCFILPNFIKNNFVKQLDISWNRLSDKDGLTALVKVIVKSAIQKLNFSWNAIGPFSGPHMKTLAQKSKSLLDLDLSHNRLDTNQAKQVANGIKKNKHIEVLRIGHNPLSSEDVYNILQSLLDPKSVLKVLDMDGIEVEREFLILLESLLEIRDVEVIFGKVLNSYPRSVPDVPKLLVSRAKYEAMNQKKKKKRKDFGAFLMKIPDKPIAKSAFRDLINNNKIKVGETLVTEIMKNFEGLKKKVDIGALKEYYLSLFPDTPVPVVKEKTV